ncbi:hypothetical protein [Enterococcus casseliflavus]|uniref:hypothetical protein n=1 Tax=Enterococcus casseliflavus TaxID=37734 RepID=UPI0021C8B1DB|nr:hypothetical protein [Enterococcus casseliflavus]
MSKDKRMILVNALDAFERLDLSKVQSINLELVEYDDGTNRLALEVIYSPEVEKKADGFLYNALNETAEERGKKISDLIRGASGL